MKEHSVNKLNNFIAGWYLEDTKICDDILKFFETRAVKEPGMFLFKDGSRIVDPSIKDSVDGCLDDPDLFRDYGALVFRAAQLYQEKYTFCKKPEDLVIKEYHNIQYYSPNGGYHVWHSERGSSPLTLQRCLAYMTYLNDVSDGGETEWFYQNLKIKPEKGLTVIWPTDWTFTHRGITSPTQEKMIVTGWISQRV